MRRLGITKTITRLLICIVVGLITSVGVAWVTFFSINLPSSSLFDAQVFETEAVEQSWWWYQQFGGHTYVVILSTGDVNTYSREETNKGPSWSRVHQIPDTKDKQTQYIYYEEAWGWPMVCTLSVCWNSDQSTSIWTVDSGIQVGTQNIPYELPKLLPTRPIWIGLLVNTAFYATITWLLLFGCILLRNTFRIKHYLCVHCRYKVRDLSVCPECGSAVVTK